MFVVWGEGVWCGVVWLLGRVREHVGWVMEQGHGGGWT
jgi:hypothetical protein